MATRAMRERVVLPVVATCQHNDINVIRSMGSAQDDHETVFGVCRSCKAWIVSTLFFGGGHIETRNMTDKELTQFRALKNRRGREEWWEA